MAGIAVGELSRPRVQTSNENTGERQFELGMQESAIHAKNNGGIPIHRELQPNIADYVGEPHARWQAFAGNVSHGKDEVILNLEQTNEVAGEITHGENLAGDLEGVALQQARTAEPALDLSCFE